MHSPFVDHSYLSKEPFAGQVVHLQSKEMSHYKFGNESFLPTNASSLLRWVFSIVSTGAKFSAIYLAGVAAIFTLSTLFVVILKRLVTFPPRWPRLIRALSCILAVVFYSMFISIFALPDAQTKLTIAPSFTWAVIWSFSFIFIAMVVCVICCVAALKLLPLIDWLPGRDIAFDFSEEDESGSDWDRPAVKIQMGKNASFANCQHVSDTSPLTIETLCKEMKPGQTLAIHKHDTLGIHNQDYVGVFHFFESPIDKESNN